MTVTGQPSVVYTYDNANRLTQITQDSSVVSFIYDAAGRRTSLSLPSGNVVEYSYDAASRVTAITYKQGQTVLGDLTYEYDKAGNRTKIGGTWARTGLPEPVDTTSYDAGNRQLTFEDKTLTYDDNGNLTTITDASGTIIYTWNARNQLTGLSGPGMTASFVYDALGRRESKTIDGVSTAFVYDGLTPVQELSGTTVAANNLTGLTAFEFFGRTDSAASTFLTDPFRNTVALADSLGAIKTEYTYEPFGKATVTGETNANPFQFRGRQNDGTGLVFRGGGGGNYQNSTDILISQTPFTQGYLPSSWPLPGSPPGPGGQGNPGSGGSGQGGPGPGGGGPGGGSGGRGGPSGPGPGGCGRKDCGKPGPSGGPGGPRSPGAPGSPGGAGGPGGSGASGPGSGGSNSSGARSSESSQSQKNPDLTDLDKHLQQLERYERIAKALADLLGGLSETLLPELFPPAEVPTILNPGLLPNTLSSGDNSA